MEDEFINITQKYNTVNSNYNIDDEENKYVTDDDDDDDDEKDYKWNYNTVKGTFENCNEDINFGGSKELVKFTITTFTNADKIVRDDYVIMIQYIFNKNIQEDTLYIDDINAVCYSNIKKMIRNKIIETDKIYDLNNKTFLKKIKQCKTTLTNVVLSEKTSDKVLMFKNELLKNKYHDIQSYIDQNKIEYYIKSNCIINDFLYCHHYGNNQFDINKMCHMYSDSYESLDVYKHFGTHYDYEYLRKYIPYIIHYNDNSYYIENRNYACIKLECENDAILNNGKSKYLFNDGSTCWSGNKKTDQVNLNNIINQYKALTKNKNCLTSDDITRNILMC